MTAAAVVPPPVSAMCVTPFDEHERLDEVALRHLVHALADAGVGVYLGSYGTGEGHLLRADEVGPLYEIGVDAAGGRVPVYAAALGFQATDDVIRLAEEALACGTDAVQVHPPRPGPIAIRPTRRELERYYADVLDAIRAPVILTNQVVMVGYALPLDLLEELVAAHDHVIAVNTSDTDPSTLVPTIDAAGRAPTYTGVIGQLVDALRAGGAGTLCFEADIVPALCNVVVAAHRDGDAERRDQAFALVLRLNEVLARHQNPRSVKAALHHLGRLDRPMLRRPYLPLDAEAVREIGVVVDEVVAGSRDVQGR
jgi:4-hydroxy-tetrahydrodipicolinate synthase